MGYVVELETMVPKATEMVLNKGQEGANQSSTRENHHLPKKMRPIKEVFEKIGFTFKEYGNEILYEATLPKGWSLEPKDEYNSDIIDEKGRKRGVSHYNSFLDINGDMKLFQRFDIVSDHIGYWNIYVKDFNGDVVYTAGQCKKYYSEEYSVLFHKALEYLETNYPEWENPARYWEL